MNPVISNIKTRRSRRNFLDKEVLGDVIYGIIEAGRFAPSALNKQPWKFIIVSNKEVIHELYLSIKELYTKIYKFLPLLKIIKKELRDPQILGTIEKTVKNDHDTIFFGAPLLIIIVSDKDEPYAPKDCAIAAENMMLYAHSIGVGSCYIGKADLLGRSKRALRLLGLTGDLKVQASVVFGYCDESLKRTVPLRREDNIIRWIR